MNAKDFLDLMGEIDGDLIVNAKLPVAPRRAPAWRKLTVIAAAACLLVGVLSALVLIGMQENWGDTPPVDTESATVSQAESSDINHGADSIETPTSFDTTDQPEDDSQIDAPYTVLVIGPYDGVGSTEDTKLVTKEYDHYVDGKISKEEKILVEEFGNKFEFSYEETYVESFSGLVTHTYVADNGVTVKFEKTNEKIVFFDISYVYTQDNTLPKLSEQECVQIAQTYLQNLTENADQYNCTDVYDYDGKAQGGPCYIITFTRSIGCYKTYDRLILRVTKTGDITCYNKSYFGCADGITLPSEQEHAQMQASAIKAMEKMYEGRKYTYELRDVYISYDAQGKLAVEFMIDMDVWPQDADEDAMPWAELCHLLIYPEDLVTEDTQKNAQ